MIKGFQYVSISSVGNLEEINEFLGQAVDVNFKDEDQYSLFYVAAEYRKHLQFFN